MSKPMTDWRDETLDRAARALCTAMPMQRDAAVIHPVFPAACDGPGCACWPIVRDVVASLHSAITTAAKEEANG